MDKQLAHREWLDNEYSQWTQALGQSTVHNFKEHPMVKRMLGDFQWDDEFKPPLDVDTEELLLTIDNIGRVPSNEISGTCWRMIYYAQQVLEHEPISIIEIGGGVGQFYAVMRAMGYEGDYYIADIPEVKEFQNKYLQEVEYQTDLYLPQVFTLNFCVSFYALGEFHDLLKEFYIQTVVNRCLHGFIIWNPHSGASDVVNFPCSISDEYPLLAEGNKQLDW